MKRVAMWVANLLLGNPQAVSVMGRNHAMKLLLGQYQEPVPESAMVYGSNSVKEGVWQKQL